MKARKFSENQCQCAACGAYFGRVSTFDRHRVGEPDARRCLTVEEMEAKGWRVNDAGFWTTGGGFWKAA